MAKQKTIRTFIDSAGEATSRVTADTQIININFCENDQDLTMKLTDLDPGVMQAAAAFGIATSVTNAFGGVKEGVDEEIDRATRRWEGLLGGAWAADRVSGPRTTDVLVALCRVLKDAGHPVSDEKRARFAAQLADPEDTSLTSKALLEKPKIAAVYEAIKLERAQARADTASEKAAKQSDNSDLADLI